MASASEGSVVHETQHVGGDEEKGFGALHRTTTMVTMPPDVFEKACILPILRLTIQATTDCYSPSST
jgi:hypothetical protein